MNKLANLIKIQVVFRFKRGVDPFGIVGGVTSLGAAGISAATSEKMNRENIAMQRETNEQNYKMFHEQQDFAEQMFNKANTYNSPEQIAQRLRDVGVNPLKVLAGEGSNMQSAGLQSSPSGSPMVAPKYDTSNAGLFGQGLSRAVDSYFANMNQQEDIKAKKLELLYQTLDFQNRLEKSIAEKEKLIADKGTSEETRELLKTQVNEAKENLKVLQSVFDERVKAYGLQNELTDAQKNLAKAQESLFKSQEKINKLHIDWIPKQYQQQIKESENRITTEYMKARAADVSADAAAKSADAAMKVALKTDGIEMNEEQREEYIKKKIDLMESEYQRNMRQGKSWFKQAIDATEDIGTVLDNGQGVTGSAPYGAIPVTSVRDSDGRMHVGRRW